MGGTTGGEQRDQHSEAKHKKNVKHKKELTIRKEEKEHTKNQKNIRLGSQLFTTGGEQRDQHSEAKHKT